MKIIKIFISSVQNEFSQERNMLYEYLSTDALLGKFFEPFIFENLPAKDQKADEAYLSHVKKSDIYLGIFGKNYGYENKDGFSPTENEYNFACKENKTRLIFISNHKSNERNSKELALIHKAENEVIRKKFSSISELRTLVYASLVNYLEEKDYLRTVPFDASICKNATFDDIDNERISEFVALAREKRKFPLPVSSRPEKVLTHLDLFNDGKLTNASILLFGKNPQHYFISSEIKCVQFYGTEIVKPIPSYHIYKGDAFQLVDQAVDFVLSRIDARVGTRNKSNAVPFDYEIPRSVVSEAIVNAVAHRDYTSNASVQVMLFKDRLEIWNPGQLPDKLTLANLKFSHSSIPRNPLLANPLFFAGYIEKVGTGIPDMLTNCKLAGLKEPDFKIDDAFKIIIYRAIQITGQAAPQVSGQVTPQAAPQVTPQAESIRRVVLVLKGELTRAEIQELLKLKDRKSFIANYLNPALESGFIEMTLPDTPTSPNQRYHLTTKGKRFKTKLNKEIKQE
jgi:predicted HTH transcriptional regulator